MTERRPQRELQPTSKRSSASYPRRNISKKKRRVSLPTLATALFVGGALAFGASLWCFENLDGVGFYDTRARLSGLSWQPDWPVWADEELLGVEPEERSLFAPWMLALPLVVLGGLWFRRADAWLKVRQHAFVHQKRIGDPVRSLDHGSDGRRAVLEGELSVEGPLVDRFEDGAPAAVTAAVSARVKGAFASEPSAVMGRAERLVLHVNQEKIPLKGDVNLLVGSAETLGAQSVKGLLPQVQDRLVAAEPSSMTRLAGGKVTFRSIAPGDRVKVSGMLRKASRTEETSHYRSSDLRWLLVDEVEGTREPLEMVYQGRPRIGRRSVPLILLTLILTVGCSFALMTMLW